MIRVTFSQTHDERLMVLSQSFWNSSEGGISVTTFADEDIFIRRVMNAELAEDDRKKVLTQILVSMSQNLSRRDWLVLDLSETQTAVLGLEEAEPEGALAISWAEQERAELAFEFTGNSTQLYNFLMKAPTAFVMLSGPKHRFVFANHAYLRLMNVESADRLLGLPVREALPDVAGEQFYELLDEVYRSGVAYVGTEMQGTVGTNESKYFDFVYHPVRNAGGEISGIFVQASDVTDRALNREVSEHREHQLYRQWVELSTIYSTSPVGMMLYDAGNYAILRVNEKQAAFMGEDARNLVGKNVLTLAAKREGLKELLEQAAHGEAVSTTLIDRDVPSWPWGRRTRLIQMQPLLDAWGKVEYVSFTSVVVPSEILPGSVSDPVALAPEGIVSVGAVDA